MSETLTDRERQVLEAVIRTYVETAEAAGSRTIARRYDLGVSPATVRNTMADLEEKGFLFHPHTSAGRMPTDRAYRYFVDGIMRPIEVTSEERQRLRLEMEQSASNPLELLLGRAAHALGLLTGELGVVVSPRLEQAVLEQLELVSVAADKVLMILTLGKGTIRTVYVDLPGAVPPATLAAVTVVLNERLAGSPLSEIRKTLELRLRDAAPPDDRLAGDLINIFLQSGTELLEAGVLSRDEVVLGRTSVLASQPEFADEGRLRSLIELTEERDLLASVLAERDSGPRLHITIGTEHDHPQLSDFTLVTSPYRIGSASGVIGVIGPTRMPYEKVVSIVQSTSLLVSRILGRPEDAGADAPASDEVPLD